jgi:predicted nuclease of predicted toxin-antitoxin system
MASPSFLLDENVPASIGTLLGQQGYSCTTVQDLLAPGTPDRVVHETANNLGAILVTWNVRDFQRFAAKFPRAGLLFFKCPEVDGRQRMAETLDLVLYEWTKITETGHPGPLMIEIKTEVVRILHRKMAPATAV